MAKKKLPQGGRTTKNRRKQRVVAPVQRRAGAPAGKPRAPKKSNASQAGRRQFSSKKKEENKKAAPCKAKKKGRDGEKLDPKAQQTAKKPFKKMEKPVQRNNVPHEPIGIASALTVPYAADIFSTMGSTTDPSKKVGRGANTGAQNGSGNTIRRSTTAGSSSRWTPGTRDLASKGISAKQKRNRLHKKWTNNNCILDKIRSNSHMHGSNVDSSLQNEGRSHGRTAGTMNDPMNAQFTRDQYMYQQHQQQQQQQQQQRQLAHQQLVQQQHV